MQAIWQFAEQHFEPKLFFASFDPKLASHFKSGKFSISSEPQTYFNMPGVAVGTWFSHWEPGHYWFNRRLWEKELAGYEYCFVASGTPIAAHPLVYLNKKFIVWAATPYDDDRVDRVRSLSGARKLVDTLAARRMRTIERSILETSAQPLGMSSYATQRFNEILGSNKAQTCGFPMPLRPATTHERAPIIVAAARWTDPRKNVDMLLRAFAIVKAKVPQAELHLFGQPVDRNCPGVTWHGYAERAVMDAVYDTAGLLVISSFQEGFGIVGLEAMSRGIPVVSTDCGGPRDFVVDGRNGFLVLNNNAHELAQKMILVLSDMELQQQLSAGARATIAEKFDTPVIHAQWKQLFVQTYPELEKLF